MRTPARPFHLNRSLARFSYWLVGTLVTSLLTLIVGVGAAAVLSKQGATEDWSRWSNVGQTFGVLGAMISSLALIVVVLGTRIQQREMQRTSAASFSMLHLEILRLGIEDSQLSKVWPEFRAGISDEENRQFLYANIIYQFQLTSLHLAKATDEEVISHMRYLLRSPIFRAYWEAAADGRSTLSPGSLEYLFARRIDDLCQEIDTAVAQ
ncbi:hypothetical protein Ade02nite_61120 [Paractinoplanes deccanensis]|uniref:DUF4760 domain-containing protein n=1 Tax=Paractinoplanes deccanensis TaxID=113561 RepID=A0ABQ3YBX8_9ACTN|nr:DUF6082 family protein [Actinoplanes deccanensis]GID77471.1 hypothetical protein Ade02nite_61120 [Actinoplanes deccanensis]